MLFYYCVLCELSHVLIKCIETSFVKGKNCYILDAHPQRIRKASFDVFAKPER